MVGEFDEVYVMDWGLQLIDDEMPFEEGISLSEKGCTQRSVVNGSPMYMAPEQAREKRGYRASFRPMFHWGHALRDGTSRDCSKKEISTFLN